MIERKWTARLLLAGIIAAAFALRVRHLMSGVPLGVGIDEPAVVDRALEIVRTGNWNPRGFDYPSLVIYMQAMVNVLQFLRGAMDGRWGSLDNYDIASAYEAGRFVTALLGTATVWLTYRLGKDLHSRTLGLLAAACLAVYPMHVRESHFVLTDAPATALVALALLLTLRAARRRTMAAYFAAAFAAGLAAAAKYNGGVVAIVVPLTWLLHDRASADRGRKAALIALGVVAGFLVAVPYALIDLPAFLNGLGAQMARFSGGELSSGDDAPWRAYLTHLSLAWQPWLPLAVLGAALVAWRRHRWQLWLVPIAFTLAYFYVLATHRVVYGRYALPLLPAISLLAAVPFVELALWYRRRYRRHALAFGVLAATSAVMLVPLILGSLEWLERFRRPDTRVVAGRWMAAALPKGARLVVENSGPTNLDRVGFTVLSRPNRLEGAPRDYADSGVDYVVYAPFSSALLADYAAFTGAGREVCRVDPSETRDGPFVRIVKIRDAD